MYAPQFKITKTTAPKFVTNNPQQPDKESDGVTIVDLKFNTFTRSIEAVCSDRRMRQCRIDRITSEDDIQLLTKKLQTAYNKKLRVAFIAAGGASPDTWFYSLKTKEE